MNPGRILADCYRHLFPHWPFPVPRYGGGNSLLLRKKETPERCTIFLITKEENVMRIMLGLVVLVAALASGCASVPMESAERSDMAKQFKAPANGNAGLYIYRAGTFGGALKKDVWVDGKCIGQTAPNVFFYEEVKGDTDHKISTESEFSPNDLVVKTGSGKNYFIQQYMKMGLFVGGAGLELVDDEKGKNVIAGLKLASKGSCSK